MKSICVFCGSSKGKEKSYSIKTESFGKLLAKKNIKLVYGGSNIGLMKVLANSVLSSGGEVIGIMPHNIVEYGVAHPSLTEIHIVNSMAERKEMMINMSDAFVALPGGLGTFDELFEILSNNQLELINKPCGILNINGYYDNLLKFLDTAVEEEFVRIEHRNNLVVESDPKELLQKLNTFTPIHVHKWVDKLKEMSD